MVKRKFEVWGEDQNGDIWIVGTELLETAEALAEQFRAEGYKSVEIKEN